MKYRQNKQSSISLEAIGQYWLEAEKLTGNLQSGEQFSTSELVEYLDDHLPADCEKMTKTKVNYLKAENILHPIRSGKGESRISWRYTADDVRRVLVVELLKAREGLSVQESKGWLHSFDEARSKRMLSTRVSQVSTLEGAGPASSTRPPTAVSSAYALLRNRTLGTLITALGSGETEEIPPECLIAIRGLKNKPETELSGELSWDQARSRLENESEKWYFAVSDSYFKLYIYNDLQELRNRRTDVAQVLHRYHWYVITLQDTADQFFEVILGLADPSTQQPSIAALGRSLRRYIEHGSSIQIAKFPGLMTLLRTAFINQPKIIGGTPLFALAEIIASASDAWDYCAILIPEFLDDGKVEGLRVQEYSSESPPRLKDKLVDIEKPLAGWCYRHRQGVVVQAPIENDPRIAFFEDEEHPSSAAALPAITGPQQVAGVIYVARHPRTKEVQVPFTEQDLASLRAFGYICGDMLARDQIEVGTVRSMSQLATRKLINSFDDLKGMLQEVVDKVRRRVSPENVADSWIYLLVLNIETPSQDIVTRWLCEQGINGAANFLAYKLWDTPHRDPILIGQYRDSAERYVFAVLQAVYLPEEQYKQRITALQQELAQIYLGKLIPRFYVSAVTFRYGSLTQPVNDDAARRLVDDLIERTKERLIAGPYFKRGHEALYNNDLDRAVSEFEDALRYTPDSWYGYKHLAEARMLQATEKSTELAIEKCREALKLNPQYASAHCLLADCLTYQGRFSEAIIEYEKALEIDCTRLDYLIRYGQALAAMTPSEYYEALKQLNLLEPKLVEQHNFLSQPWLEAIDKFDQVRKLSTMDDRTFEEQRERRADYHFYRGYAYLQAGLFSEAIEDFARGRKLAPGNLQLAQAFSHALRLQRSRKGGE